MSLSPGTYRARPVSAALGYTMNGNEQIAVTFETLDPAGERVTWYGYFTEKSSDRTLQSLRYCGWRGNYLADFYGEQLPEGFDQEVDIVVEQEEYQGKTYTKVAWVNSGGSGMALRNAMTQDQAKAFGAKMRRTIDALDKAADRPAAAPVKAQAKPATRPAPRAVPASRPAQAEPPLEVLNEQAAGATAEDVPY